MTETVSLFVTKDSPVTFNGDLATMSHYTFGAIRGFSYGPTYDNAVKQHVIKNVTAVTTGEQAIQMLLLGRFQVLVSDRYFAFYLLKKLGEVDNLKELSPPIEDTPTYMIFSKKRNLAHIREKFDKALTQMKQDGTYESIIENFFTIIGKGN